MDIWRSISGMMQGQLISPQLEYTLQQINEAGVPLFDIEILDPVTCSFRFHRKDLRYIQELCDRTGGKFRLLKRNGIFWTLKGLLKRPLLLFGLVMIVITVLFLPTRVLFIRVEGNTKIPSNQILSAAEDSGIRFGASRRAIRSEQVKNTLLASIPGLQWVGVNTSGCVAVISVRERADEIKKPVQTGVRSLVSSRDGYILSANATRGTLLVQPGQTVVTGQLLISGYTDCGILIRAEQAEGEIIAMTNHRMDVISPSFATAQHKNGKVKKKISILLGKKRIFLWKDSGISVDTCGRMYKEYYITLPGGFQLPAALCVERFPEYDEKPFKLPEDSLAAKLELFSQQCLIGKMTAGKILSLETDLSFSENVAKLRGSYVCQEMICRVLQEQIGE